MLDTIKTHITAILGEKGLAAASGFQYSENQYHYALQVAEGLFPSDSRTAVNALQAATGTGKTIGYLVPLMLYSALTGERVGVSTFTRLLQAQIISEDAIAVAEWVATLTHVRLKVARRVGRTAYVSVEACQVLQDKLADDSLPHEKAIAFLAALIEWASKNGKDGKPINSCVIDDFLSENLYENLPEGISVSQLTVDPGEEHPAYNRDVQLSKDADVIVVNHALLAAHAFRRGESLDDDKRKLSVLVCDEADRMADVAARITSADLAMHKVTRKLLDFADAIDNDDIADKVTDLFTVISDIDNYRPDGVQSLLLNTPQAKSITNDISVRIKKLLQVLEPAVEKSLSAEASSPSHIVGNQHVFESVYNIMLDLKKIGSKLTSASQHSAVMLTWSPIRSLPRICSAERNAGRIYRNYFMSANAENDQPEGSIKSVLFTSATLGATGAVKDSSFDDFLTDLGIFRAAPPGKSKSDYQVRSDLFKSYEPSLFGNMEFVLPDPRANPPRMSSDENEAESDPEWLKYTAAAIRAAHATGNRTLVLTTSFEDTHSLAELIADLSPLTHKRGTKLAQLLTEYKATPGAILLSPSAWEGVNLPGLVNELVISKIPFGNLQEGDYEILKLDLISRGYDREAINKVLQGKNLKNTLRKMSQGIGRAVRSRTDRSRIWICDVRFPLPGSITGSIDPVVLDAPPRNTNRAFVATIPHRFMSNYETAPVFRCDTHEIYLPEPF